VLKSLRVLALLWQILRREMSVFHEVKLLLEPATPDDRKQVARVRPPAEMVSFVHYNWFWLDRSLRDPAVRFRLVRTLPHRELVGIIAYGPFESIDQDPSSRIINIGEIYHLVVDCARVGQGLGRRISCAAVDLLREEFPGLKAVRVGHNPENKAAARLYGSLGFIPIGEKIDHETSTRDVLLELGLAARPD
jgi:RimJ/RimL family protein N-acetyltransferase